MENLDGVKPDRVQARFAKTFDLSPEDAKVDSVTYFVVAVRTPAATIKVNEKTGEAVLTRVLNVESIRSVFGQMRQNCIDWLSHEEPKPSEFTQQELFVASNGNGTHVQEEPAAEAPRVAEIVEFPKEPSNPEVEEDDETDDHEVVGHISDKRFGTNEPRSQGEGPKVGKFNWEDSGPSRGSTVDRIKPKSDPALAAFLNGPRE